MTINVFAMVKIKVVIKRHDGISKRNAMWSCVAKAQAFIYKMSETRHAFHLITENSQLDLLLTEESRETFKREGLEITTPPEYAATRTVFIRGVDSYVRDKPDEEIINNIHHNHPQYSTERVIKLPSNRNIHIEVMTGCGNELVENNIVL